MKALRIEGEFHWGFWTRFPETSKIQSSLSLPPPTTLIGALSYPLIKFFEIEEVKGEVIVKDKNTFLSPAYLFEDAFFTASIYLKENSLGFPYDDINKYITVHFQMKTENYCISENFIYKSPEEIPGISDLEREIFKVIKESGYIEKDALFKSKTLIDKPRTSLSSALNELIKKGIVNTVPRRFLPKFRSGAIIVGKTYIYGGFVIAYLINEKRIQSLIGNNWEEKLKFSAWNITRIGSKESIVSINDVRIIEAKEVKENSVKTKFYFPSVCAKDILGNYYTESFWKGGWGRGDRMKMIEYVIPGSKSPLRSESIEVELSERAKAYEILEEEILIYELS